MKKFIVNLLFRKVMKNIFDKSAKYKCPHCGEIYKYNFPKRIFYNTKDIFDVIKEPQY